MKNATDKAQEKSQTTVSLRPSREEAETAVRTLIAWAGDDPTREGLIDTPRRVVRAYEELFSGYAEDSDAVLNRTFEEINGYNDIVVVRDVPFHSHCEHHMVPIIGKAHIAYYPSIGVIGLSKLARLIDMFARRLQTQESMTSQIIHSFDKSMRPRGTALMLEAEHMCMSMRGIRKSGSNTITTEFTGIFKSDIQEQNRFYQLIRNR